MQPTSTASNPLFDRDFLRATMMGPNCVRFAEELTANISPYARARPGVRHGAELDIPRTDIRRAGVCRGPVDKPFGQLCAVPGLRA